MSLGVELKSFTTDSFRAFISFTYAACAERGSCIAELQQAARVHTGSVGGAVQLQPALHLSTWRKPSGMMI